MGTSIVTKSYFIPHNDEFLHLKRFYTHSGGDPVFMLHGSMENGKIFYSKSMKGLAPFLAEKGFDVFVADMSGRGRSMPPIDKGNRSSQTTAILSEIPLLTSYIARVKDNQAQHWVAHSWGGVLMLAYVARFGGQGIASMSFFATKRRIAVVHAERIFKVDLVWNFVGKILSKFYGFFPSKDLKIGSDNEPRNFHKQVIKWVYSKDWLDPEDGFDYHEAFKKINLPPTLYLAAKNDRYLGNPSDVKDLMLEVGNSADQFILLSRENGHLHDYDHINILTNPDAGFDQFIVVEKWMRDHNT